MAFAYQRYMALLSASVISSSFMLVSTPVKAQNLAPDPSVSADSVELNADDREIGNANPSAVDESDLSETADDVSAPVEAQNDLPETADDVSAPVEAQNLTPEPSVSADSVELNADDREIGDANPSAVDGTDLSQTADDVSAPLDSPLNLTPATTSPNLGGGTDLTNEDLYTDYLLGPGDQLETRIIGYEEFPWALTKRIVLSDGTIQVPFVGTVVAAGKTVKGLEAELANRLSLYLTVPVVDVNLTTLRPVVINVVGEVYRPGPVQLGSLTQATTNVGGAGTLTTSANTPNLSSALAAAGGIRRTADVRRVTVTRRLANGSTKEFTVNLWDALNGDTNLGVLVMFDGDTINVPKATTASGLDQSLIASSSIAPDNVRVRVVGEGVVRPGEVQVQPNSSVSGAIAAAGGPNMDAQLAQVKVIRMDENGQIQENDVDVSSLVDDYQIQDGDVVFVPKKGYLVPIDNFNRTVGTLLSPITSFLGILGLLNVIN